MNSSNESRPLVTVMVPAYNAESTIADTLQSIWWQTYRPIEVIIVNDGSTDGTAELVTSWAEERSCSDFEIHVEEQPNQGLLYSRGRGLSLSSGVYLQFLDADDVLHRDKIATCVSVLSRGEADVVVPRTCKFRDIEEIRELLNARPAIREWGRHELRNVTITSTWWHSIGPLFRRQIVEKVATFPPDVHPVAEELYFHGRIKLSTEAVVYLDEVLNFYRKGSQTSVTGELMRLYDGRIEGARIAKDLLLEHRSRSWREWWSLLHMCARTYYQTTSHFSDESMRQRAWAGFWDVANSWNPALRIGRIVPRRLADGIVWSVCALRKIVWSVCALRKGGRKQRLQPEIGDKLKCLSR